MRTLKIKLRSFYIRYILNQRSKTPRQKSDETHFLAVVESVPAMQMSVARRRLKLTHITVNKPYTSYPTLQYRGFNKGI